jgi:hypothetical protein
VQDNRELAYAVDMGRRTFHEVWTRENFERVQAAIQGHCAFCHLERQFSDLDFMVNCKRGCPDGEFLLGYRLDRMDSPNIMFF